MVLGELQCNIYKETFMLFFSLSEVKVTLLNSDVTPNSPFYISRTEVRLRVTLLWYKPSCFSNVNYYVIMLTRSWSLSQQGHLQPYSKSKAWQLIQSCKMVYSLKPWEVNTSVTKSLYSSQVAIPVSIACKDWEYCHSPLDDMWVHLKVAFYQASLTFWWYPFVLNSHNDK